MDSFPHLRFVEKITGKPRFQGGGEIHPNSQYNKDNRDDHSHALISITSNLRAKWQESFSNRQERKLAPLNENVVPIFLQINPEILSSDFSLQDFGIEIISEEDDGFIIGASLDNLQSLDEKIVGFVFEQHGTAKIAELWKIIDGDREAWKPNLILTEELKEKWSSIDDDVMYKVEVSVAFDKPLPKEPDPSKRGGLKRLERYRQLQIERDDRLIERENHFDQFVSIYGKRISDIVHLEDCFACEVEISGLGLKDLVVNYPFVFEVSELEEIGGIETKAEELIDFSIEILPPDKNAPIVGVIDSGIMEEHKLLSPAIIRDQSKCYIDGDTSTADHVAGGGHGTRVAGAILYPFGISKLSTPYQLPCFLANLRVLNDKCYLVHKFPAQLMIKVVEDNEACDIFNFSIASIRPHRKKHMSTWAATIDSIVHGKDVLFIVSSGNITKAAIQNYFKSQETYPQYLHNGWCRLANPAQSFFALTVGSLNHSKFVDDDWSSIGEENDISAFSRIGSGIWGSIKPDVVEYGGGLIVSNNGQYLIRENELTAPELIRSTLNGGSAYGRDATGTSYATPKVSSIAAQLKRLYPDENSNLIRALIVQGARLPKNHFENPTNVSLKYFGYGVPLLERVTKNTDHRVTYYNVGEIKAEEGHIYSLKLPNQLIDPSNEYDVLIEVTLAFTANVRRTRQRMKSYLSTWVDWTTSKIDENFEKFKSYALKEIENTATQYDKDERKKLESFPWKIKSTSQYGVEDFNRNNSSIQKDWAIIKSHQLPKEIGFAIRGHRGWDKNMEEIPYALTVSIELLNSNIPIYESIKIENEVEVESEISS